LLTVEYALSREQDLIGLYRFKSCPDCKKNKNNSCLLTTNFVYLGIKKEIKVMKAKENTLSEVNTDESDLNEVEGTGPYCCNVRMVLAPSEIVYECLECGSWCYSSS
jgi:hypothetical protein